MWNLYIFFFLYLIFIPFSHFQLGGDGSVVPAPARPLFSPLETPNILARSTGGLMTAGKILPENKFETSSVFAQATTTPNVKGVVNLVGGEYRCQKSIFAYRNRALIQAR